MSTETGSHKDTGGPSKLTAALLKLQGYQSRLQRGLEPGWSIFFKLAPWGTIIALVLAIKTDRGVERSAHAILESQSRIDSLMPTVDRIAQSVSTQYLDTFPGNMKDIFDVVNSSKTRLQVMCDFPAYGAFSEPALFDQLKTAYMTATVDRTVKLDMVAYNDELMERYTRKQFGSIPYIDLVVRPDFTKWREHNKLKWPMTETEFYRNLTRIQDETIDFLRTQCHSDFMSVDSSLPFFAWVADSKVAVISFWAMRGKTVAELTFRTSDPQMIVAVERVIHSVKLSQIALQEARSDSMADHFKHP
jgi:hypothetical protein